LVCYDSRQEGQFDLSDKELAKLLREVHDKSDGKAHVVVILDCCHSGSGTRAPETAETAVRLAETDRRERPLASYEPVFSREELIQLERAREVAEGTSHHGFFSYPEGRHILLAACRSRQLAKEYRVDGKLYGTFSHFLLQTLKASNRGLTYRDLLARTRFRVETSVTDQSPLVEANDATDLDRPFLGGAVKERTAYFAFNENGTWWLDAGAVHGISGPKGEERTRFALFSVDADTKDLRDLEKAVVKVADVAQVLPQKSRLEIGGAQPEATELKAVLISTPAPTMTVKFGGDEEAVRRVRSALAESGPDKKPSLFVREAREGEAPSYRLLATGGEYVIKRPADDRPRVEPLGGGYTQDNAKEAIRQLEHIARWHDITTLQNIGSIIRPDAVKMVLHYGDKTFDSAAVNQEVVLNYRYQDGQWRQPTFRLQLANTTDERFYCAAVALFEDFTVEPGLFPEGCIELPPNAETWALRAGDIPASVPDGLWKAGVTERRDILKLIVSTTPFDARLLQQGGLKEPTGPITRSLGDPTTRGGSQNALNRLMVRARTRNYDLDEVKTLNDWTTGTLTTRVVRPQEAVSTAVGGPLNPSEGVKVVLEAHSVFKAKARLSTLAALSRDLSSAGLTSDLIPPILGSDPAVTVPLHFTTNRGQDQGLSVLELTDVENPQAVTAEEPLQLTLDIPLENNERLLAYAFDGEFYLPLGYAKQSGGSRNIRAGTTVVLERLPDPASLRERSLTGSIRILFQKIVSQALGREFEHPLLAAATIDEAGKVAYETDLETVKTRVEETQRILLFIHGIIGDTLGLAASARLAKVVREGKEHSLEDSYDLILTFDYENLHTPIEENARLLKARLESVGLAADHGKTLHVVAHSMGGLVSRWFVEQEGGNRVVNHLILVGTPNAGSPWSSVQDWATMAVGVALNGLSVVPWAAPVLGGLVSLVEQVDVALDQMNPASAFMKELTKSPDPSIPYTILAGNTSIRAAVIEPADGKSSLFERLLKKLTLKQHFYDALTSGLFRAPNDIAVSVKSIKAVDANRSPAPVFEEVACDHITYFHTEVGLEALAGALGGQTT